MTAAVHPSSFGPSSDAAIQAARWSLAVLVALTVHAGAGWWLTRPPLPLPVAEAAPAALEIDISLLGFAPADQVSAGEEIAPAETLEAATAETAVTEAARPVEAVQSPPAPVAEPVRPSATAAPSQQENRPAAAPEAAVIPAPDVAAISDVQVAATRSPDRIEAVEPPRETGTAAPAETAALVAEPQAVEPVEDLPELPARAPVPTPRPEPAQVARAEPEPRRAAPPRAEPQRQPQRQAGNAGRNQSDARRGQAEGREAGRAEAAPVRGAAASPRAGNADVSNYPGLVVSRLRRSLQYPREASSQRLRGEVHVAFTVGSGGGVGQVHIARSSGHPVLDRAALQTVQRAAPFPPIPEGAGRSSWSFTVPLAFTR